MPSAPPLYGLLLAGGASTRMRRDKAALSYHGKPQLQWGLELLGEVPFRDVIIHSTILAPDGRRMSKSLGTGINLVDVITGKFVGAKVLNEAVTFGGVVLFGTFTPVATQSANACASLDWTAAS